MNHSFLSFKGAAKKILHEAAEPLTPKEIVQLAWS
jgi:hypothetical protein